MRRLPVYLLLDVSGSMRGEPIAAVSDGVGMLIEHLRSDPYALETVYLSVITFNKAPEQILPLTEVYKVRPFDLKAQYGTYLGKALRFLSARAEEEVVKTTNEVKGDWKPLVFIMTDGRSGDKVSKAINDFKKEMFGSILICATGKEPNIEALRLISENVVSLNSLDRESISAFFRWISASVSSTSKQIEMDNRADYILDKLPPLPSQIILGSLVSR